MTDPNAQLAPVLDPLAGCDQASQFYERIDTLSDAEKFMLLLHATDGRTHQANCPSHDPNLITELQEQLGIDTLPDE